MKFNPGFLTDDQIVESFCIRTNEFDSIVESLRDCAQNSSPHTLVIGPRGIGKTHLLLRVAVEVRRDPALASLFPIVFAEESYEVTSCGEFWLECLNRLADQAPDGERANLRSSRDDLQTEHDDRRLAERCLGILLDFADRSQQRLLLLVENLNMLFDDMTDQDAGWRLRKTLQTEPRIVLLGSATSRFEEIDNHELALYDLFRVKLIEPLTADECAALWMNISGRTADRQSVRPLQILTGGNPRLLTIVASFGSNGSFRELMANLLELVDEHTEYFRTHLEYLPAQERRVFLVLARLWRPSTAREVSEQARIDSSTCSALMNRLVKRGSVAISGGTPRRRQYYLTERLYNIYYLLRRGGEPGRLVEALIEFMVCFYAPTELTDVLLKITRDVSTAIPGIQDDESDLTQPLIAQAVAQFDARQYERALAISVAAIDGADSEVVRLIDLRLAKALHREVDSISTSGGLEDCLPICSAWIAEFDNRPNLPLHTFIAAVHFINGVALLTREQPRQAIDSLESSLGHAKHLHSMVGIKEFISTILLAYAGALQFADRPQEALAAIDQILGWREQGEIETQSSTIALALTFKVDIYRKMNRHIGEDEFRVYLESLAADSTIPPQAIRALAICAIALGEKRVLRLIQDSPAEPLLSPLVVALKRGLGQNPRVSKEVNEVADDLQSLMTQLRGQNQIQREVDEMDRKRLPN